MTTKVNTIYGKKQFPEEPLQRRKNGFTHIHFVIALVTKRYDNAGHYQQKTINHFFGKCSLCNYLPELHGVTQRRRREPQRGFEIPG